MASLFASKPTSQETASLFINEEIASARSKVNIDMNASRTEYYKFRDISDNRLAE